MFSFQSVTIPSPLCFSLHSSSTIYTFTAPDMTHRNAWIRSFYACMLNNSEEIQGAGEIVGMYVTILTKIADQIQQGGTKEEGIFRLSASPELTANALTTLLIENEIPANLPNQASSLSHCMANVLKTLLRRLPCTLFTTPLFHRILNSAVRHDIEAVKVGIQRLPINNRKLVKRMVALWKHIVAQEASRMTTSSLAVVIGPTLLPEDSSDSLLSLTPSLPTLFSTLIDNFDYLFPDEIVPDFATNDWFAANSHLMGNEFKEILTFPPVKQQSQTPESSDQQQSFFSSLFSTPSPSLTPFSPNIIDDYVLQVPTENKTPLSSVSSTTRKLYFSGAGTGKLQQSPAAAIIDGFHSTNVSPCPPSFLLPLIDYYSHHSIPSPPINFISASEIPSSYYTLLVHKQDITTVLQEKYQAEIKLQMEGQTEIKSNKYTKWSIAEVEKCVDSIVSCDPVLFESLTIDLSSLSPSLSSSLSFPSSAGLIPFSCLLRHHNFRFVCEPAGFFSVKVDFTLRKLLRIESEEEITLYARCNSKRLKSSRQVVVRLHFRCRHCCLIVCLNSGCLCSH